ncbi:hypothetical protein [Ferruginibacter albus]|uniref:hypothetical protein n=1 Tax=Ferruginibacter albus TaxID=2875540 RepID=UPI001CC6BE6F|nr:hypothetical protein [Ferruginibacter albus]UAY53485.1 hypothetical protein K9M53_07365 [Ferruginibacter albus]
MLKTILTAFAFLFIQQTFSQDIDLDKNTGLVKVDGKDAFYLIKTHKVLLGYDLSLQNLAKQELAYFAMKKAEDLPYYERGTHTGAYFQVTFSETANSARIFPNSFAVVKAVAKEIVAGNLIKDEKIDPKAEKAFVVSHEGTLLNEPQTIQVNVNTNTPATSKATEISIKTNSIYNNDELIGSFKQSVKDNINTVSIYNKNDDKIAVATHPEGDADADWNVTVTSNNTVYQLLYNSSTPLEKLFKSLADKGLF